MKWEKTSFVYIKLTPEGTETEDQILRAIAQATWETASPDKDATEPLVPSWEIAKKTSKRMSIRGVGITALDMDKVCGKLCNTLISRTIDGLFLHVVYFENSRGSIEPMLTRAQEILTSVKA